LKIKTDYWIERDRKSAGYPIMVPVVDLVEIGNGGGSIAWVDDLTSCMSAHNRPARCPVPQPMARAASATTTDANLALGRINKDYFCGGAVVADMGAVDAALGKIAAKLDGSTQEAARGIIRIANNNMINALKLVSLNRGHDPRDFTLVAFGGGGGMHAVALATELGIRRVVIPRGASVFSAWGMMMSDLRRDYFFTRLLDVTARDQLGDLVNEAKQRARDQFKAEKIAAAELVLTTFVKCRYQNQEHSVEVELVGEPSDPAAIAAMIGRFEAAYEREYTYNLDAPIEIVGLHLIASAEIGKLEVIKLPVGQAKLADAIKGRREVDYAMDGVHMATIYDAEKLEPGMNFQGPAIIEDPGTTLVVHPGNTVSIDAYGNTHIQIGK
jgi:N-methylhydantoinase A